MIFETMPYFSSLHKNGSAIQSVHEEAYDGCDKTSIFEVSKNFWPLGADHYHAAKRFVVFLVVLRQFEFNA